MPYANRRKQLAYWREYNAGRRAKQKRYMKKWRPPNRVRLNAKQRAEYHAAKKTPGWQERESRRNETRRLKKLYGISPADLRSMQKRQGSRCAICEHRFTRNRKHQRAIDHNHATGRVRGLLCFRCNVGLGHLGDTAQSVRRALDYLERAA